MSFILDALRKSEAERQDGRPPGLADVRRAAPRSRIALWAPLGLAVLLANLLLLWLIWRGQATTPAAVAVPPAPAPVAAITTAPPPPPAAIDATAAPAPARPAEPLREVRPLARETLPRAPATAARPAMPTPDPVPATLPRSTDPISATEEMGLPRLEDLVGSGRLNLPPLALELHVWSERPASRFVFINSARYREGERLAEGPLVEQITTGGVVLSQGGERFVLSRP